MRCACFCRCSCAPFVVAAAPFQLVSVRDPARGPPAVGSGDSYGPILTPDGNYVLFASIANNLVLNNTSNPIPALIPAHLNVFLRDRTNGTTTLASVNLSGAGGGNADSLPEQRQQTLSHRVKAPPMHDRAFGVYRMAGLV